MTTMWCQHALWMELYAFDGMLHLYERSELLSSPIYTNLRKAYVKLVDVAGRPKPPLPTHMPPRPTN